LAGEPEGEKQIVGGVTLSRGKRGMHLEGSYFNSAHKGSATWLPGRKVPQSPASRVKGRGGGEVDVMPARTRRKKRAKKGRRKMRFPKSTTGRPST